jgi:hypothetical protein
MGKRDVLTKCLAVAGTWLVWFPVLAPILFAVASLSKDGRFRFDYLMPAELFLAVLTGSCLLLWAALRARSRRGFIGWSFGVAAVLLLSSMALAEVTGLASGETETGGWQWVLVLATLIGYDLAVVVIGVGGLLLLRDLFKKPRSIEEAQR